MNRERKKLIISVLLFAALGVSNSGSQDAAAGVFTNGLVHRIQITIPPEGVKALRATPRQYVTGVLSDASNTFAKVGFHLKGSVGSFRSIDGKPAFTISFDKFTPGQRFHGLRKMHLNNSVEDPSYMNELIGSDTFLAAGVPAPRVAHALVEFNGRRLGLYVLKEGFTEDFLSLHFRHPAGNLYDLAPGGHDVNEPMEKALGQNPEDRSDLDALAAIIEEPDVVQRWAKIPRALDLDRFLSFMVVEIMLGHRDGYCLARNNFRIYHDVDSNRLVFMPHGMDVLLGNPRAALEPRMNGLVGRAIMETPEGRRAYRARFGLLYTNIFDVPAMHSRIDRTLVILRSALPGNEAAALDQEAVALKERIVARGRELKVQLEQPPLELVRFVDDVARLTGWQPFDVPDGGSLARTNASDGRPSLTIKAGPVTAASWRVKVLLPPGKFRLEGAAKTSAVAGLPFGKNQGASIRVSGAPSARPTGLLGEQPWRALQITFETKEREQEVDLVCELRASRGTGWFDAESLRLVRLR